MDTGHTSGALVCSNNNNIVCFLHVIANISFIYPYSWTAFVQTNARSNGGSNRHHNNNINSKYRAHTHYKLHRHIAQFILNLGLCRCRWTVAGALCEITSTNSIIANVHNYSALEIEFLRDTQNFNFWRLSIFSRLEFYNKKTLRLLLLFLVANLALSSRNMKGNRFSMRNSIIFFLLIIRDW